MCRGGIPWVKRWRAFSRFVPARRPARKGPSYRSARALRILAGRTLWAWRPQRLKSLVVAGAAGGFAAVFNAPIAGVLFATEVLLKEFTAQAFGMVVLSTVTASVTTHLLLGNEVFVQVPPEYSFNHPVELVFYAVLAILLGDHREDFCAGLFLHRTSI